MKLIRICLTLLSLMFVLPLPALANHHEGEAALETALAGEARTAGDQERDATRKPAQVLEFLGVEHGMTVMDLIAAGGYYTEVLSLAVGAEGNVYAQNPPAVLKFRDGANDKAMTARLAEGRLANVTRMDADIAALTIPSGTLDVVITALNFHDIYNGSGRDAALGTSRVVNAMLAPGGVFGVIDHVGTDGNDNAKLHRIDPKLVIEVLEEAGFKIDATSDLLANSADGHDKSVFDPSIRGNTDRFLIRAVKITD